MNDRTDRQAPSTPAEGAEEIERVADEFLAGCDLDSDVGRFRAWRDGVALAQESLLRNRWCNRFLERVALATGREPAFLDSVKFRVPLPEDARLDLCYDEDGGFVITGNHEGLGFLAGLLTELRDAPCENDYVHIPNDEKPIGSKSYGLTIHREEDAWFERLGGNDTLLAEMDAPVPRAIVAGDIFALQFLVLPPPELPLTLHRIYRVRQSVPVGQPSEGAAAGAPEGRRRRFELLGDARRPVSIVLHLDDPEVNFFTKRELLKVVLDSIE
jgi:hypothetical protein